MHEDQRRRDYVCAVAVLVLCNLIGRSTSNEEFRYFANGEHPLQYLAAVVLNSSF